MSITSLKSILILFVVSVLTTACDNKIEFGAIAEQCAPPGSSARYGTNPGPVIEHPLPDQPTNGQITLKGTCEPNLTVYVAENGSAQEFQAQCSASGKFEITVSLTQGDGNKDLVAYQNSLKGEAIKDRRCFTMDTVPPAVNITNSTGTLAAGNNPTIISGTCENGLEVTIEGPNLSNGPVKTKCNNGKFQTEIQLDGPDGLKDVVATQTDPAGNKGDDDEQYLKDTTPPVVKIDSPTPLTLTQSDLEITGQCEGQFPVVLQGSGISRVLSTPCNNGQFRQQVSLSNKDGLKNIVATQVDEAKNEGHDERDFMKDSTPPAISIAVPAVGTFVNGTSTIEGSCEAGLSVELTSSDISAPVVTNCSLGSFSAQVTWTMSDGPKAIFARQTDNAGNLGQATSTYMKDTLPPAIKITSPANGDSVKDSVTISGTCESGLAVNIEGNGVATPVKTNCAANKFSANIKVSANDGSKVFVAYQVDTNNNRGEDSVTLNRDTTGPNLTITAPAENSFIAEQFTLTGTCESGLPVNISGDAIKANTSASCNSSSYSILLDSNQKNGDLKVTVSQTDANNNSTTVSRVLKRDLNAPTIKITSPKNNSYIKNSFEVSGTCETGLEVELSGDALDKGYKTSCVNSSFSAMVNASINDGSKKIIASQTDFSLNKGEDSITVIIDTTAPNLTITSPVNGTKVSNVSQTVTGQCESGFDVTIDGNGLTSSYQAKCTSGNYSQIVNLTAGDGDKIINATQADAQNNVAKASVTIALDSTAPVLTIANPTENQTVGSSVTVNGVCETGIPVELSGSALTSNTTANCNNSSYSKNVTVSNTNGKLTITAKQTDSLNNTTTVNRNVIRDLEAPLVKITSPTAGQYVMADFNVKGSCEANLQVNISGTGVASQASGPCTSGSFDIAVKASNGDGNKTITASQTDAYGNTGSDSVDVKRDSTAPILTITSPANNSRTASKNISVTGACESGLPVKVYGSGLTTEQNVNCSNQTYSAQATLTNGDGKKLIQATQTDAFGNTANAQVEINLDTTGPMLTIVSPQENQTVGANVTVTGQCEAGSDVMLSGSALASAINTSCTSGNYSQPVNIINKNGALTIIATQTDSLNNTSTVTRNINRDLVAPVVTIASPANNALVPATFTISGKCETGLSVVLSGSGLDKTYTANCSGSAYSQSVKASSGDGNKVVTASQTDAYGNTGSDSKTFVSDTTPPKLTITSPTNGSYTKNSTLTVTGACETDIPVIISSADIANTLTVNCNASTYSTSITFITGDGNKVIVANQTDASGNNTAASVNVNVDTTAPAIKITSPANNSYHSDTVVVSGQCETGLTVALSGSGLVSDKNTNCSGGSFSTTVDLTASDSLKNIIATQTDAVGNKGSDSVNVFNDETAPIVTIENPAAGTTAKKGLTIDGTCEDGLDVTVSGSGSLYTQNVSCNGGVYTADVEFSLGDGSKLITVAQVDKAKNGSTDSRNFVRDNTAPNLTINSPAEGSYQSGNITVTGQCENGTDVKISGSGIKTEGNAACSNGSYSYNTSLSSGDGNKQIIASQADAAGNSSSVTRDVVQDTTAPMVTITSPAATDVLDQAQVISGACESGLSVLIAGDVTSAKSALCSSGTYSVAITLTPANGAKTITASQTDAAGNRGSANKNFNLTNASEMESFISQGSNGKVDILFIDDNSASMDTEQQALGTKFASFSSELSQLDWQIGITTTDCSTGPYGICGSLLDFPTGSPILTRSDSAYVNHFKNTIQRPETFDCILAGTCPSGNEQALLAAITAMDKRSSDNSGFFRDDAQLAIVILSDEDEQSDGKAGATTPDQLINHFKSIWPNNKVLSAYGIIVMPGDSNCLATQQAQFGGSGNYGTYYEKLAEDTQGMSVSICATDYSKTLKTIGENVRKLTTTYELSRTPIPNTVTINFTPSHNTKFTVSGKRVTLETPPPAGTKIDIYYEY